MTFSRRRMSCSSHYRQHTFSHITMLWKGNHIFNKPPETLHKRFGPNFSARLHNPAARHVLQNIQSHVTRNHNTVTTNTPTWNRAPSVYSVWWNLFSHSISSPVVQSYFESAFVRLSPASTRSSLSVASRSHTSVAVDSSSRRYAPQIVVPGTRPELIAPPSREAFWRMTFSPTGPRAQ